MLAPKTNFAHVRRNLMGLTGGGSDIYEIFAFCLRLLTVSAVF
jgi:hypothetical protein